MASGDCGARLQIHLCDRAVFLSQDFDDRVFGVDGHAISGWPGTVRRREYSADQCCLDRRHERPWQSQPAKVENDMKRMSAYEVERRSEKERCVLFQTVSQTLIRTRRGTRENISRVRVDRLAR